VAAFEEWPLQERSFDLVVCATAFHWIDPDVRMQRVADSLRTSGSFALIDTAHIAGGTMDFFAAVHECYQRWDPTVPCDLRMSLVGEVSAESKVIDESGLFGPVTLLRYVREIPYTADEYIDVLRTYSGQVHLSDADRFALYDDIHRLIVDEFDGRIVKAYLTELRLARVRR
jgi:SAM-dependent methyltransferase